MALFLTEADVRKILTMPLALEAVEAAFQRLADGSALLHLRQRLHLPGMTYLNYMAAGDAKSGYMGLKIYTSRKEGLQFLVPLFHVHSGDLAALIEANCLGQVRTGAASGVATRLLARPDARVAGIIGAGLQARTQLEAVAMVRKIEEMRVFSRNERARQEFATEMTARLGLPVKAVFSAEEAARDVDILITSTTATNPVVEASWLRPGMHINAIGANFPQKRELEAEAIRRCDLIAVDSREQSKQEAGDLIQAFAGNEAKWTGVQELADIVAGKAPGRNSAQQITLFKSNGIAIEDVVVAARVYELARERGVGKEISLWDNAITLRTGL